MNTTPRFLATLALLCVLTATAVAQRPVSPEPAPARRDMKLQQQPTRGEVSPVTTPVQKATAVPAQPGQLRSVSPEEEQLPYAEIGAYPADYSSGNVLARMIDGLGYRYYWATKDLREQDLQYRVTPEARTLYSTLEHLYGLSDMTLRATQNAPRTGRPDVSEETYATLRAKTLKNFKAASETVADMSAEEVATLEIIFSAPGEEKRSVPFWHAINGPIADALWHAGQVVTLRRAAGNPVDPNMNVFMGKTKTKE